MWLESRIIKGWYSGDGYGLTRLWIWGVILEAKCRRSLEMSHKKEGKKLYGSRVNASVLLRSQSDGVVASLSNCIHRRDRGSDAVWLVAVAQERGSSFCLAIPRPACLRHHAVRKPSNHVGRWSIGIPGIAPLKCQPATNLQMNVVAHLLGKSSQPWNYSSRWNESKKSIFKNCIYISLSKFQTQKQNEYWHRFKALNWKFRKWKSLSHI